MGIHKERKNFAGLLRVMDHLWERKKLKPGLVMAGLRPRDVKALERLRRDDGLMVPAQVDVLGIPDRVTIDRDGRWQISDYKTGGKLEKEVEPKNYLIGQRIQLH